MGTRRAVGARRDVEPPGHLRDFLRGEFDGRVSAERGERRLDRHLAGLHGRQRMRALDREGARTHAAQRREVRGALDGAREIARKRADVRSAGAGDANAAAGDAAGGLLELIEGALVHGHHHRRRCDRAPGPSEIVRTLAADVLRGECGRHLVERPDEPADGGFERMPRRQRGFAHDGAVGILGVGLRPECDDGVIALRLVVHVAHEPRGAAEEENQESGRERVERPRVPDSFLAEGAPRDGDDVVRGDAGRLVDEQQTFSGRRRILRACCPSGRSGRSGRSGPSGQRPRSQAPA